MNLFLHEKKNIYNKGCGFHTHTFVELRTFNKDKFSSHFSFSRIVVLTTPGRCFLLSVQPVAGKGERHMHKCSSLTSFFYQGSRVCRD